MAARMGRRDGIDVEEAAGGLLAGADLRERAVNAAVHVDLKRLLVDLQVEFAVHRPEGCGMRAQMQTSAWVLDDCYAEALKRRRKSHQSFRKNGELRG